MARRFVGEQRVQACVSLAADENGSSCHVEHIVPDRRVPGADTQWHMAEECPHDCRRAGRAYG
jgi:hypothetical protein